MRHLTVVQVLPALEAGGVERSTLEIAAALVGAGHRAIVVSAGGRLVPALERSGAQHVTLPIGSKSPWVLRQLPALRRVCAAADIVHARSRLPAWLAWLAMRGMPEAGRPRFMTTAHGLNSPSRYSAIMGRGERVICVSNTVRQYLLKHYRQLDPSRLRVIPRGIDPQHFPYMPAPAHAVRARIAAQYPALGGMGPLLLLPGRGTRLKGHADAIGLLAQLRQTGLDARLWMPGARQQDRSAYVHELEQQAQAAGVAEYFVLSPATDAMHEAYAACDLVLQLSRKPEAFGRTVIEALATGRPVLGWEHGGVGELLRELQPQGAVPSFQREALVQQAQQLLSAAVTMPVTMPYTLKMMQEATLALYQELMLA